MIFTPTPSPPNGWRFVVTCIRPLSVQYNSDTAPQSKFTSNLQDKVRYVVHFSNLKLYLPLDLIVTRVHSVLTFKQTTCLETYIDFNTPQSSLAGIGFLKNFFTIMKKSVFGKTQEKRVQHCCTVQSADTYTESSHSAVRLTSQSYACKIPSSGQHMPFTQIISIEIWRRMQRVVILASIPSTTHYSATYRKAYGYFKDELNSVPMQQFVGLHLKCYAFHRTGQVNGNILQHTKPVEKKSVLNAA